MLELSISPDALTTNAAGVAFIPLGQRAGQPLPAAFTRKIAREIEDEVPGIWGTLGMYDDSSPLQWRGKLQLSRLGTLGSTAANSGQATLREINDIYRGRHPRMNQAKDRKVRERFLSFEKVTLPAPGQDFTWNELPALRLTLFLNHDEGALVFYQHMGPDGPQFDRNRGSDGTSIEYLLPDPTSGHTCSGRDRLTYRIPALPTHALEATGGGRFRLSRKRSTSKFVVKILTFKRGNSASGDVIQRLATHTGLEDYRLWQWDVPSSTFKAATPGSFSLSARTLLFIHGTFSSTQGCFGTLSAGYGDSWIARVANTHHYDQILALDYPTILVGPDANAAVLQALLGGPIAGEWDVITHSQGGLVAKALSQTPGMKLHKGALAACANGVGYFTAGWTLAKFLSVAKCLIGEAGNPMGAFLTGLAQHSAEFFLNQPGCQAMTPGSPALAKLLGPALAPVPEFRPVAGDYDSSLVANLPWYKRWAENGLDLVIKGFLGDRHDWVVGCPQQVILDPSTAAPGWNPTPNPIPTVPSTHTTYFGRASVQIALSSYLVGASILGAFATNP